MPRPWSVLIIDDHPVVQMGLSLVLEKSPRFVVCGHAANVESARRAVEKHRPDLIILDLILGGRDGLEFLKELAELHPTARILVFSSQPEMIYARRAFQAGAWGYLMKDTGLEQVPDILTALMQGERFASEAVQREWFQHAAAKPSTRTNELSDRETQVLRLLGARRSTAQIAEELCLSIKTIGTYRERLKTKLGAQNARELEHLASEFVRTGRLDPKDPT